VIAWCEDEEIFAEPQVAHKAVEEELRLIVLARQGLLYDVARDHSDEAVRIQSQLLVLQDVSERLAQRNADTRRVLVRKAAVFPEMEVR
jgi:hypothetical protein